MNRLSGIKVFKNRTGEIFFPDFDNFRCLNNRNLKMDDFLQKMKEMVRIVLYGPAVSQSDYRKASPYQRPYIHQNKTSEAYWGTLYSFKSMLFVHNIRSVIKLYENDSLKQVVFTCGFLLHSILHE